MKLSDLNNYTNTAATDSNGRFACQLYDTEIVHYNFANGYLTLDTGGHFTATTSRRMNEALEYLELPFTVVISTKNETAIIKNNQTGRETPFDGSHTIVKVIEGEQYSLQTSIDRWKEIA